MNIRRLQDAVPAAGSALSKQRHPNDAGYESVSPPATKNELWLAYAVVATSVLICLAVVPFARVPLTKITAFIPSYESALVISDLITAALLSGRATQKRSSAYLALACGYLFCAAIIVPHLLTFPGIFSGTGLLGANEQSAAWLYVFWHGGFPLFALCYVFFPRSDSFDTLMHYTQGPSLPAAWCASRALPPD